MAEKIYKCLIWQYAPSTGEKVNLGVLVADDDRAIQKFVGQEIIDQIKLCFPGNWDGLLKWTNKENNVWHETQWPDNLEELESSTGYAMSTIKYHSTDFIRGIARYFGTLENFGDKMFGESCVLARQGIYGNMPEAVEFRLK